MVPLDIIVRTHYVADRDPRKPRYCGAPKNEVTRRCLISLVHAINEMSDAVSARLTLYDDNSGDVALAEMRAILDALKKPHIGEIIQSKVHGATATMVPAFTYLRDAHRGGYVYSLEDDYLCEPGKNILEEMVNSIEYFRAQLGGRKVALYPFNDPYRYYVAKNIELTRVVQGPKRHWRLNYFTTGTFFTTPSVLRDHFESISALGKVPVSATMEDDTINKVWKEQGVTLFTPIPSVALHIQCDTEKDPYIPWETWWEAAKSI